jgi:undecaprenyl-diphosphatase
LKESLDSAMALPILTGMAVAAISGFIAIKTMIKLVSNKKLFYFSIYTWILGIVVLAYTL